MIGKPKYTHTHTEVFTLTSASIPYELYTSMMLEPADNHSAVDGANDQSFEYPQERPKCKQSMTSLLEQGG